MGAVGETSSSGRRTSNQSGNTAGVIGASGSGEPGGLTSAPAFATHSGKSTSPGPFSSPAPTSLAPSFSGSKAGIPPSNLIVEEASRSVSHSGFSAGSGAAGCCVSMGSSVISPLLSPMSASPGSSEDSSCGVPRSDSPPASASRLASQSSSIAGPITLSGGEGWFNKESICSDTWSGVGLSGSASDSKRKFASVSLSQSGMACSRGEVESGCPVWSSVWPVLPGGGNDSASPPPDSGEAIKPDTFKGAWQYRHSSRSGELGLPHNGQMISVIVYPP